MWERFAILDSIESTAKLRQTASFLKLCEWR
jgi:hypothetical protein